MVIIGLKVLLENASQGLKKYVYIFNIHYLKISHMCTMYFAQTHSYPTTLVQFLPFLHLILHYQVHVLFLRNQQSPLGATSMCLCTGPSTTAWVTHQGHLVTSARMLPPCGATLAGPTGQDLAISVLCVVVVGADKTIQHPLARKM